MGPRHPKRVVCFSLITTRGVGMISRVLERKTTATTKYRDMADYRCIEAGKPKRWTEFIASIREGEEVVFGVDSPEEIDTVRTVASRINTSAGNPYRYAVEANSDLMVIRITTKRPL